MKRAIVKICVMLVLIWILISIIFWGYHPSISPVWIIKSLAMGLLVIITVLVGEYLIFKIIKTPLKIWIKGHYKKEWGKVEASIEATIDPFILLIVAIDKIISRRK